MKRFISIFAIGIVSCIALLFIIPYLIPDTITREVTKVVNKNIKGEVRFREPHLSFFSHFPSLTLNLENFLLKGSAPYQQDTLLYAQVSFDGRLNLKGRLGLPPFGIFGIPLSITGAQDNPIVKLKRNKEGKLEETAEESEESH